MTKAAIDPNSVVQTGPGLPQWAFTTVRLVFSGPVTKDQRIHLVLGAVPDGDRLFEAAADEQLTPHCQPIRPLQVEDPHVRRALLERDRLATIAVDRQYRARQEARIRGEETGRRGDAVQISTLVADHEGRTVKKRKTHAVSVPTTG